MTDPTDRSDDDPSPVHRAIAAISLVLGVIGVWAALIAKVLRVW